MSPAKCPNCRLSLPQNWAGMNDPNSKCPYCGKSLAGKAIGATQTGQAPSSPTQPEPPPAQPASRPAGGAKTMLWGVGSPIPGMPGIPGVPPKPVAAAPGPTFKPPEPAAQTEDPARPVSAQPNDGMGNAATMSRNAAETPQPPKSAPASDGAGLDVNVSEALDGQVGRQPTLAKAAATVMFQSGMAIDPGPSKVEPAAARFDTNSGNNRSLPPSFDDKEPASRPVKSKGNSKPLPKKGQRRSPAPAKWGSAGASDDEEAPQTSSKKGLVIAIVVAAVVVVAGIAAFALHGRKNSQVPSTVEAPKPAEPATNEDPALAAKPAPEPAKAAEPEQPTAAEKPAAEDPGRAEKPAPGKSGQPEKAAHPEKAASEGKPKPETDSPVEAKGDKPSEIDYQRASDAYQRGNTKLFQGNTADAINDFNQALRLNPKDPAIHRGLGLAYAQSGNSAEAIKHLKAYLKAAPKANDRAMVAKRIRQLHGK